MGPSQQTDTTPNHSSSPEHAAALQTYRRIMKLGDDILHSDVYARKRGEGMPHEDAVGQSARELSGQGDDDEALFETISHLGVFVQSALRLTELEEIKQGNGLTSRQAQEARNLKLNKVIPFNDSLKEMISSNPELSYRGLVRGLTDSYTKLYGVRDSSRIGGGMDTVRSNTEKVMEQIQSRVDGMRHEVAAEALLIAAGLEYDYKISANDDVLGMDLFVRINGNWEYIDVKASETGVLRARQKNPYSHAVWTGLYPKDFTGRKGDSSDSVAISYDKARSKCDEFVGRILEVLGLRYYSFGGVALDASGVLRV